MSETDAIKRAGDAPATVESLTRDLRRLGVKPGMCLLVHSSLSRLGWVCGGAQAVVMALEAALGAGGTLVMPAHSADWSEPSHWSNPPVPAAWWPVIRDNLPAYDPSLTPSRGMGAIAECFLRQEGTLRSNHPQVSFAARGPKALEIISDHKLDYGLGEGSPLARLYDLGGWVLLLGVGHDRNTSFHLAEHRADWPGKKEQRTGAAISVNGERRWVEFREITVDSEDFGEIGEAFHRTGAVRLGRVAQAGSILFPQQAAVDFAVQWIEEHRR